MKRFIILVALLIFTTDIYASNGGSPIDYMEYPYLSAIVLSTKKTQTSYYCLAAITNSDSAITAAHCFSNTFIYNSMNLFAYTNSQLTPFSIKEARMQDKYDKDNLWYDIGLTQVQQQLPAQKLDIDQTFNPFDYISNQTSKEVLFTYFGLDNASLLNNKLKIMSGTLSVMSGDKCSDQIEDLLEHEEDKFDTNTVIKLTYIETSLKLNPFRLFCVFNKKNDLIQGTQGDSGGPLVIKYNNKNLLAGTLSSALDISASQNYSKIIFFTNIYNSYPFLDSCQAQVNQVHLNKNPLECLTVMQWWEQFRISLNDNVFALEGTPGLSGLVRLLPQNEREMVIAPYYIQGSPLPW